MQCKALASMALPAARCHTLPFPATPLTPPYLAALSLLSPMASPCSPPYPTAVPLPLLLLHPLQLPHITHIQVIRADWGQVHTPKTLLPTPVPLARTPHAMPRPPGIPRRGMRHVSGGVGAASGGGDHRRGGTPRCTTLAAAAATTIVAAVVADATAAVTAVVAGSCRSCGWSWRSCGGRTWSWRSGSLTAPSLRQARHLAGRSRTPTFHTICPHSGVPGAGPESVGGVGYAGGAAWAAELREAVDQLADAAGRGAGSGSGCSLSQEKGRWQGKQVAGKLQSRRNNRCDGRLRGV